MNLVPASTSVAKPWKKLQSKNHSETTYLYYYAMSIKVYLFEIHHYFQKATRKKMKRKCKPNN